jgi:hypothetical protein
MKKIQTTTKVSKLSQAILLVGGLVITALGGYMLYGALNAPKQAVSILPPVEVKASAEQKTPAQKQAYAVPPTHPRQLVISKLGIDANILPMGTTRGILNAPVSAWDVGWYDESGLPGLDAGALLIDGHVNDALNSPGVFYKLLSLSPGDQIDVERGDGQHFVYSVVDAKQEPLQDVDMNAMLQSATPGKQGLNLITCGGTYNYETKTYDDRVLVFAVMNNQ